MRQQRINDEKSLRNNVLSATEDSVTITRSKKNKDTFFTDTRKSRRLKKLAPIDIRDYDYNNNIKIEKLEEFFKNTSLVNNLNVNKIKEKNKQGKTKNVNNLYPATIQSIDLDKSLVKLHQIVKSTNNNKKIQDEDVETYKGTSIIRQDSMFVKPKINNLETAIDQSIIRPSLLEKKLIFMTYLGLIQRDKINSKANEDSNRPSPLKQNSGYSAKELSKSAIPKEDNAKNTYQTKSGHINDQTGLRRYDNTNNTQMSNQLNRRSYRSTQQRTRRASIRSSPQAIEAVQKIINNTSRISLHKIVDSLPPNIKMGYGTVRKIVKDTLQLKKVNSRWIPHSMNDSEDSEDTVRQCMTEKLTHFLKTRKQV